MRGRLYRFYSKIYPLLLLLVSGILGVLGCYGLLYSMETLYWDSQGFTIDQVVWSHDSNLLLIMIPKQSSGQVYECSAYLVETDSWYVRQLPVTLSTCSSAAWSLDSKKIALADSEIKLIELATEQTTIITTNNFDEYHLIWSPDNQKIAFLAYTYSGKTGLFVVDVQSKHRQDLFDLKSPIQISDIFWTTNSQELFFTIDGTKKYRGSYALPYWEIELVDATESTFFKQAPYSEVSPDKRYKAETICTYEFSTTQYCHVEEIHIIDRHNQKVVFKINKNTVESGNFLLGENWIVSGVVSLIFLGMSIVLFIFGLVTLAITIHAN